MNNLLHLFNLHLTFYDDYKNTSKKSKITTFKKYLKMKQQNRLLRDILRGLKANELMVLHANVKRIENLIDEFSSLPNIFVPF